MASMEIKPVQLCLYLFHVHFPTKSNFVSICSMLNLLAPIYPSHFPAAAATTMTTMMVTAAVATTTTVMAAAGTVDDDDRHGHGRQRQWARAWSTTDTGTVDDDDGHWH